MNKSILIGIVAFGGLLLLVSLLPKGEVQTDDLPVTESVIITLPPDLPTFPMFSPAQITRVQDTFGENSRDVSVGLTTIDVDRELIHDWYRQELNSGGWSITNDRNVGGYQIIQGEKDNLYTSLQVANGNTPDEQIISQQLKVREQ
jgi:hypothetical protein